LTTFYTPTELAAFVEAVSKAGAAYDFSDLVVHDPSAFTTDWDLNARVRLVESALRTVAPELGTQSLAVVTAFMEARDAVFDFAKTGNRARLDDTLETHLHSLASEFVGRKDEEIAEILVSLAELGSPQASSVAAYNGLRL
jgi:hypothetical protein